MNSQEFDQFMAKVLEQLGEHCDACRIFLTRYDADAKDTESYTIGHGNFHAQIGVVREWVERQEEYVREKAKTDARNNDEEEP